MVLQKSKCLHENPVTSCHQELEYTTVDINTIIKEVGRWQAILSVNYANFNMQNNIFI